MVCCYDPVLKDKGVIVKYNNLRATKKERKVEHVRWFESMTEGANSNKFIVVFDDGTFYVFFRDTSYPLDRSQEIIRIPQGQHANLSQVYS